MKTVLVDRVKMLRTTYTFRVNKLPGRINVAESNWKVSYLFMLCCISLVVILHGL